MLVKIRSRALINLPGNKCRKLDKTANGCHRASLLPLNTGNSAFSSLFLSAQRPTLQRGHVGLSCSPLLHGWRMGSHGLHQPHPSCMARIHMVWEKHRRGGRRMAELNELLFPEFRQASGPRQSKILRIRAYGCLHLFKAS